MDKSFLFCKNFSLDLIINRSKEMPSLSILFILTNWFDLPDRFMPLTRNQARVQMESRLEALEKGTKSLKKEISELRASRGSTHEVVMELKRTMGTLLKEKKALPVRVKRVPPHLTKPMTIQTTWSALVLEAWVCHQGLPPYEPQDEGLVQDGEQ